MPTATRPDLPFDRRLRRLRRARMAAAVRDNADWLLRHMGEEVLDRLALVRRRWRHVLQIGAAPGLTNALAEQAADIVVAESSEALVMGDGAVCCDEDRLPFADGHFDLVVSVGALDSVNDLPGALVLIRRVLRPDGLFLGAMLGAGSLPQLRGALRAAEEAEGLPASPRLHPQIDVRAAGDLLTRAGFALPVADTETITARYASLLRLAGDLRANGATNTLVTRSVRPFGRLGLAAAAGAFSAAADADGKTPERFDILHMSGWAPSPDQPKPAKRGSATASLATALGRGGAERPES